MIGKRSYVATADTMKRDWYVVDATGKTLGRLAAELATRLRGKHRPQYTPGVDCGDFLIVINADKITVTGNKTTNKMYYRYTGYVGNMKEMNFEKMMQKDSSKVLQLAVKGMLPRGPLGRQQLRNLKVYSGNVHPHEAQEPLTLSV